MVYKKIENRVICINFFREMDSQISPMDGNQNLKIFVSWFIPSKILYVKVSGILCLDSGIGFWKQ